MANLDRRLWQSKIHADTSRREDEEAVGREVMRLLTDEENRTILERVERLYEEVVNEETASAP